MTGVASDGLSTSVAQPCNETSIPQAAASPDTICAWIGAAQNGDVSALANLFHVQNRLNNVGEPILSSRVSTLNGEIPPQSSFNKRFVNLTSFHGNHSLHEDLEAAFPVRHPENQPQLISNSKQLCFKHAVQISKLSKLLMDYTMLLPR